MREIKRSREHEKERKRETRREREREGDDEACTYVFMYYLLTSNIMTSYLGRMLKL